MTIFVCETTTVHRRRASTGTASPSAISSSSGCTIASGSNTSRWTAPALASARLATMAFSSATAFDIEGSMTLLRRADAVLLAVVVLLGLAGPLRAAEISGHVVDTQGRPVREAVV